MIRHKCILFALDCRQKHATSLLFSRYLRILTRILATHQVLCRTNTATLKRMITPSEQLRRTDAKYQSWQQISQKNHI